MTYAEELALSISGNDPVTAGMYTTTVNLVLDAIKGTGCKVMRRDPPHGVGGSFGVVAGEYWIKAWDSAPLVPDEQNERYDHADDALHLMSK